MSHDMHGLWAVPAVSVAVITMLLSSSNNLSLPTLATMPQGVTIPNMMRETVVRMLADFRPEEICTYTDVSERQQSRILKVWRDTGASIPAPNRAFRRGHPRNLSAEEVFVSALYILCREPQRLMNLARGPSSDHVVPSQFHRLHLQHIPRWAPGNLRGYLWYSSIIIYNLADVEACWISYEEGMLALLSFPSPFSFLTTIQLSRHALERSVIKRTDYVVKIATEYQSYQLVFVNESSCDRQTTYRNRAWAIGGRKAVRKAFFIRGQRYVLLLGPILS